jgi:uncharacterized membrane protein YkvA (DUF1232 family)
MAALVRALRGATRPGEPGLGTQLRAVPRWVAATLSGSYQGTTRGRLTALAAAALYVLSPVDLVPEAVLPFIGLADDALVVAWLAGQLLGETDGFLRWERERAAGGSAAGTDAGSRWGSSRGSWGSWSGSPSGSSGPGARRPAGEDVVQGHVVR